MTIGLRGEHLIFSISQPRAGSTMLQRILSNHSDVHTVSEPWLMLHPFYALRAEGLCAEYDEKLAKKALNTFLGQFAEGEDVYFEGLRRMYQFLYDQAVQRAGRQFFLDKTPRYFLVIPELHRTFPEARFIVLLRNPMAVMASVLHTWIKGDWFKLHYYTHDLLHAPRLILEGIEKLGKAGVVIHYEKLVSQPKAGIETLCERLGIPYQAGMEHYGRGTQSPRWMLGDPKTVYERTKPIEASLERWVEVSEDAQAWRLMREYLMWLGPNVLEQMGYGYEGILHSLELRRPADRALRLTFSLNWLMHKERHRRTRWERLAVEATTSLRQEGAREVTAKAFRSIRRRIARDLLG